MDRQVQLGFAIPVPLDNNANDDGSNISECTYKLGHQSPYWSDWDGGKIGGRPSWLNPRDLPEAPLRCGHCIDGGRGGTVLQFITQLYCPADDVTDNKSAFHRSLYVFACPTCCSTTSAESLGIRVLRCQLPKENDFYPHVGAGESSQESWTKHLSQHWAESTNNDTLNLCAVSGQRSKGKCPKQQLWFCGPDHQKEYFRAFKRQQEEHSNGVIPLQFFQSVCYESELVVEEEPTAFVDDNSPDKEANNKSKTALFDCEDITDADADLEQGDLNALTGDLSLAQAATGVTDTTTLAFYARMAIGQKENDVQNQCLRYYRWPKKNEAEIDEDNADDEAGPLWLSSNDRPPSQSTTLKSTYSIKPPFPPPCQYCGAPRSFEFQVLPQMLHFLLQNPAPAADGDESNGYPSRKVLTESESAVLLEAKSKIESGIELPEGFLKEHELAVANARLALLGNSNSNKCDSKGGIGGGGASSKGSLDWGTIAIYTCTASCGNGEIVSRENGAYREETAWVQPPLV